MLRRRADGELEFLALEALLRAAAPPPLTLEQRERIWARIASQLGPQEVPSERFWQVSLRRKWVAIPVGAGVAATIVAASWPVLAGLGRGSSGGAAIVAAGELRVGGQPVSRVEPGRLVYARTEASLLLADPAARLDLVAGSRFELVGHSPQELVLRLDAGALSVASPDASVRLTLGEWVVHAGAGSAFRAQVAGIGIVDVFEGTVQLASGGSERCQVRSGEVAFLAEDRCFVSPASPPQPNPAAEEPAAPPNSSPEPPPGGGASGSAPGQSGAEPPGHGGSVPGSGGGSGPVPGNGKGPANGRGD